MPKQKTYFNWSTGKDSALALHYLLQDEKYAVDYLLTSVNAHYQRVSMHGLPVELLQQQFDAIGIPNGTIQLPEQPTNVEYETLMGEKVQQLKADGFGYSAFGDILLEDLKKYREQQLEPLGIKTVFPLWQRNTAALMEEFIGLGFKTIVVCVNASLLDSSFAGRIIDKEFLKDLPAGVDPCGENGEFHTFCFDAPYFKNPIDFKIGETVYREYTHGESKNGFWFCDLLPKI
ncbi:MAG: diphthine--ammonia ligase [Aequorivita sp.]